MKIVNILGGLGNQMFQYAFAVVLRNRFPQEEILIDTHHFNYYPWHNGYEIDSIFSNADLPIATPLQILKLSWYIPHYKLSRVVRRVLPNRKTEYIQKTPYEYDSEVYNNERNLYYEGYWQHFKYFEGMESKLKKIFSFGTPNDKNHRCGLELSKNDSVGIHVRRGDYVGNKGFGGICTEKYYLHAINSLSIKDNTVVYVFSNDISWCKEHIEPMLSNDIVYVDWNRGKNSYWDMYLMTKCRKLILANSSFSWWGAYLNDSVEQVIAPKKWRNMIDNVQIQMPQWYLI